MAAVIQFAILWSLAFGFGAKLLAGDHQKPCKTQDAILAEEQAALLKNWEGVYQSYNNYVHCDDGAIAEGYNDSISRLLSDEWSSADQLNQLILRDKGFKRFVLKHIDELMSPDQAKKIRNNTAMQLLQRLCNQSSDPVRSEACQALKDLNDGRCVYMGPGSPNPNRPDFGAVPKTR